MRTRIGMRWWLAGAFAAIAALTAFAVSEVFSQRSEDAFRDRAQELAAGAAVRAAIAVTDASGGGALQTRIGTIADRSPLALFVFDDRGALLTPPTSRRTPLDAVPERERALRRALEGRRFVATEGGVGATVVALPLRAPGSAVMLAYAAHPDLAAELGIVQDEIVVAAAVAVFLGVLVGILVARLIAARLRRIAAPAHAIERGRFDTPLRSRFPDELGELVSSIASTAATGEAPKGSASAWRSCARRCALCPGRSRSNLCQAWERRRGSHFRRLHERRRHEGPDPPRRRRSWHPRRRLVQPRTGGLRGRDCG